MSSGVKVGQIYRDFSSKDDIIAAVAFRDLSRLLREHALQCAIHARDLPAIRQWVLDLVSCDDTDGYRLMPEIIAESSRNPRIARLQDDMNAILNRALRTALYALAPGDNREAARASLADLILTLGGGLCLRLIIEAQRGGDCRMLCVALQSIILRELDLIQDA